MAAKTNPLDPSNVSPSFVTMAPRWDLINTLIGGTAAMRAAGTRYLPKHRDELDDDYKKRLEAAVLYNMVEFILDQLGAMPFKEPIALGDDVPADIADMCENIDLQGNNLDVFALNWFKDGLGKSFSHVLVEFPRVTAKPDGAPRTLEDDRKDKLRPYWIHVRPENVIYAMVDYINGVETLTHIRIMEYETTRDGFVEIIKKRIRVLEPGKVFIWEQQKDTKTRKEKWVKIDEYETSLDFIPLVTFYSARECFMEGKPVLTDLAYLNIAHFQSDSDQRAILTVARFPIMACAGAAALQEGEKMVIGPNDYLYTKDVNGKYYYVEHTGAAIGAGRQDLKDLEEKMANYGAQFLKKAPGNQTATARALDSSEAVSPLQAMALSFQDALEQALLYTAKWIKKESGGSITICTDELTDEATPQDLDALDKARARKDISREAVIGEYKRRGVLDPEYDAEADKENLAKEAAEFNGGTLIDLTPGAPDGGVTSPSPAPAPSPAPSPTPAPAPAAGA